MYHLCFFVAKKKEIVGIQSLQAHLKPIKWKAHDATILCVDWNPINQFIITGSEDCHYKLLNSFFFFVVRASEETNTKKCM